MTEKVLTVAFAKYLKKHPRQDTECYEVKRVLFNSFNPNSVEPHQIEGLLTALEGLYHRIPDQPWIEGGHQKKKPFDCLWIKSRRSFVCPIFYKPRRYKKVFLIPIKEFLKFEGKSIKMSKLEEMGFESFYL